MTKYVLAYHGGKMPETPEEGEKEMAAWGAWMEGMGDKLVDGGNPVGKSHTLTADGLSEGGGANPLSGYTVIEAGSVEEAAEMAKGCPILNGGHGSIEIAPVIDM